MSAPSAVPVRRSFWSIAADLCTFARILLAPVFAALVAASDRAASGIPLAIYGLAAATDFADGRLARGGGAVTRSGRVFDHCADALFLFPAFFVFASHDRLPALLPPAALIAFGLYCVDGWRRGGSLRAMDLRSSRAGAAAGVTNYTIAGAAAGALWLRHPSFDAVVYAAGLAAAALNLAAALERVRTMRGLGGG